MRYFFVFEMITWLWLWQLDFIWDNTNNMVMAIGLYLRCCQQYGCGHWSVFEMIPTTWLWELDCIWHTATIWLWELECSQCTWHDINKMVVRTALYFRQYQQYGCENWVVFKMILLLTRLEQNQKIWLPPNSSWFFQIYIFFSVDHAWLTGL